MARRPLYPAPLGAEVRVDLRARSKNRVARPIEGKAFALTRRDVPVEALDQLLDTLVGRCPRSSTRLMQADFCLKMFA